MKIRRRTGFHQIVIEDRAGLRSMEFAGVVQSTARVGSPAEGGLEYIDFFHFPMVLRDNVRRVLFIGLGGGSGPSQFQEDYPEIHIDVVEIDAEIVALASELFSFHESPRCRVHVEDGFDFINRARRRWDVIVVDAYMIERGELVVPRELTTESFFESCRARLSRDGILVFNSAAAAEALLTCEVRDSLAEVFSDVIGFEAVTSDNAVLLASSAPLESRLSRMAQLARDALKTGRISRHEIVRRSRQLHKGLTLRR